MATRQSARQSAPKAAAKATVVIDHVEPIRQEASQTHAADVSEPGFVDMVKAFADMLLAGSGLSWKRFLAASLLSLAASVGAGLLVGKVLGILLVATAVTTGSLAITLFVGAIGCIVAFYLGKWIAGVTFDYVASKQVDADYAAARAKVDAMRNKMAAYIAAKRPAAA